jgi:hypothetical protein
LRAAPAEIRALKLFLGTVNFSSATACRFFGCTRSMFRALLLGRDREDKSGYAPQMYGNSASLYE